jgi:hypothetical protein
MNVSKCISANHEKTPTEKEGRLVETRQVERMRAKERCKAGQKRKSTFFCCAQALYSDAKSWMISYGFLVISWCQKPFRTTSLLSICLQKSECLLGIRERARRGFALLVLKESLHDYLLCERDDACEWRSKRKIYLLVSNIEAWT